MDFVVIVFIWAISMAALYLVVMRIEILLTK